MHLLDTLQAEQAMRQKRLRSFSPRSRRSRSALAAHSPTAMSARPTTSGPVWLSPAVGVGEGAPVHAYATHQRNSTELFSPTQDEGANNYIGRRAYAVRPGDIALVVSRSGEFVDEALRLTGAKVSTSSMMAEVPKPSVIRSHRSTTMGCWSTTVRS